MNSRKKSTQSTGHNLTLVSKTATTTDKLSTLLADIPTRDRTVIFNETKEFLSARAQTQLHYLGMGEHLERVRTILEPKGKFLDYLGCLPNIGQATAYRMIWAFQNAQKALPKATLEVAMAEGFKLISNEKGKGFAPGVAAAIAKVTKELGPAPESDTDAAHVWLQTVMHKKRELARTTKSDRTEPAPTDLHAKLAKQFGTALEHIPESDRTAFTLKLVGMMLFLAKAPVYKVRAVEPPPEIAEALQGAA